ncbi:MAG: DNA adenine methylase [Helicobacteraceae bacterium]|nr:DNA adenine methylase [Helicobacteraceae bacterium]
MKVTKLKPPHGWVGGKSRLAKEIVNLIPEDHRLYVEVFGGAMNILYAKEKQSVEVVNDINSELINLHRSIRNNPQSLTMYLNNMLISRELFDDIKNQRLRYTNNIQRAAYYYYQLTQSFGSKGENFAMNAKSRKPKNIYREFTKWSERLKGVTIENMSFEKLLKTYDKEDAFFYCDPPYVETESYYKNTGGFGVKEHELLAATLKQVKGKFLLSYNDHKLVRELYKDFKIVQSGEIEYTLGKGVSGKSKKVREIFVMNY